jgi:folate-binding protein YgfZ
VTQPASPESPVACALPDLGVIAVRGPEARKFLNGQLSQDALALHAERVELAGLHNAQGRVLAVLRLVPIGSEDVLCVLPRELIAETLAVLRRFLLRAKARLSDESAQWCLEGLPGDATLPSAVGAARAEGDTTLWRHASDGRVLRLRPVAGVTMPEDTHPAAAAWRLADIAAGLPQVTAATRGEFVAQMLNLDLLGGISFTKGCYTGQEVIARAHYRGRVKRRAQRFRTASPEPLQPGQKLHLQPVGGTPRSAQVVEVADSPSGREFLAVAAYATAAEPVCGEPGANGEAVPLAVTVLPLPYPLPD